MKWLRALGSLTVLVGVLFGVPWLLLALGQPGLLLDVDWPRALTRPDDGRVVLALLSMVGWIAWAVLAASIAGELVAVLTRRRIDWQPPGTHWLRPVVAALVAAATFSPTALAQAAPSPASIPTTVHLPSSPPLATAPVDEAPPVTGRTYIVQPGDELWSVAESQLGSGERWRDLLTVNPHLGATTRLDPGDEIQLPPDVTVGRGDSLWRLAERHLGDGERWVEIHALNADLIADPDQIDVGWHLLLPTADLPDPVPLDEAPVPDGEPPAGPAPDEELPATPPEPSRNAPVVPPPPAPRPSAPAGETSQTPAPASAEQTTAQQTTAETIALYEDEAGRVLGPIGGLLASTIVVGVAARRRLQLLSRAIGRRLVPLSPEAARFWTALARRADDAPPPPEDVTPTTVVLGWRDDDTEVRHCLEQARATSVTSDDPQSFVAALLTGLLCAPWSADVEVVLVGADESWSTSFDDPRLTQISTVDEAVSHCTKLGAQRRLALGTDLLDDVRALPDRAPSFRPTVYLFAAPLAEGAQAKLEEVLGFGRVGLSIVTVGAPGPGVHVEIDGASARLGDVRFRPQLVEAPARRALVDLFAAVGSPDTEQAPWWTDTPRRVDEETAAEAGAPYLVLLGEPELLEAPGTRPQRAVQQCVEYCAWLLLHPRSTSSVMQRSLVVAEGTRRSNMSRLRKWLGTDADGKEFLPDAYSGRIELDPRVTSDWQVLQRLVGAGVNHASDRALRRALTLVRGTPLGTAATRWPWARTLHDDMASMIVDIACVLVDRCLEQGHLDEAGWALEQAERAASGHDELALRRVRLHTAANEPARAQMATASWLVRMREDNREISSDHAHELHRLRRRPLAGADAPHR